MRKILILQNELSAYNVPVYNIIAQHYDLTLAFYLKDKSSIPCLFKKKKLESMILGPFTFIKGLRNLVSQYDVVSIIPNLRNPSYCLLPFLPHKNRILSWSIGFRVSYKHPFLTNRRKVFLDSIFKKVLSACDANIFYTNKAREFWTDTNLKMDNVFEAINTTDVEKIDFIPNIKKDFLFVGTLYKGKGLDLLFEAFYNVIKDSISDTKLRIVGAGTERIVLEKYVEEHGLKDKIVFHGPIYEEKEIAKVFQQSLLCFSPKQAGLSVPKSMGYGVPFVTRKDAITGGEIYHITPNVNGITYESDDELPIIMKDALQNREKYVDMGIKAMDYYYNRATIKHMAQGAIDAIEYALNL